MRRTFVILFSTLTLAACGQDTSAPDDSPTDLFDEVAVLAYGSSFAGDPGSRFLELVHRLPDNLALTTEQRAQIQALVAAFLDATRADREALSEILRQAREAAQAGSSREEVRAILEQGLPIRERLLRAETQLRADVLAVLTAEQRAWLDAHRPGHCTAAPLTDAQKAEISALVAAFELANRDDLDAIRTAIQQARAAHQNGASRAEIHAILESVRPAMERVRAARAALAAAIAAVLTPEQRASGCYRFAH